MFRRVAFHPNRPLLTLRASEREGATHDGDHRDERGAPRGRKSRRAVFRPEVARRRACAEACRSRDYLCSIREGQSTAAVGYRHHRWPVGALLGVFDCPWNRGLLCPIAVTNVGGDGAKPAFIITRRAGSSRSCALLVW